MFASIITYLAVKSESGPGGHVLFRWLNSTAGRSVASRLPPPLSDKGVEKLYYGKSVSIGRSDGMDEPMIHFLKQAAARMALDRNRGSSGLQRVQRLGVPAVICVNALMAASIAWSADPIVCPTLQDASESDRKALFKRMRDERGFTILIRHADKLGTDIDGKVIVRNVQTAKIDESECKDYKKDEENEDYNQRLNDHGVEQAEILNAVFDYLRASFDVRIDYVVSSNSCRALETARIAFDDGEVIKAKDKNLKMDNDKRSLSERLREDIRDKNRVLITHSTQIRIALNVEKGDKENQLGCAEAAVLKFESVGKKLSCVARILPEEWLESDFKDATEDYYWNSECPAGAISVRSARDEK